MTETRTLPLSAVFAEIIQSLRQVARDRAWKIGVPMMLAIDALLGRKIRRFDWLLARIAAGLVPVARGPRAASAEPRPIRQVIAGRVVLPRGFGWMCVLAPQTAAAFGSRLEWLLFKDAELQGLVAASPELARLLRTVFRITGRRGGLAMLPPIPPRPRSAAQEAKVQARRQASSLKREAAQARKREIAAKRAAQPRFSRAALYRQGMGSATVETAYQIWRHERGLGPTKWKT